MKLPAADEPKKIVLHMSVNEGMDGAGSHPEIFGKDAMRLSKSGHSLKSCQVFAIAPISCSTAIEKEVYYIYTVSV